MISFYDFLVCGFVKLAPAFHFCECDDHGFQHVVALPENGDDILGE